MEKPINYGCQNCSYLKKGLNVTPNPSTWESLTEACLDVYGCLNSSGPCGRRLIVHFSLPGTHIHIDIGNDVESPCLSGLEKCIRKLKAAGVLCVLGISLGIGTYVLYKIYNRFIRPPPPRDKRTDESTDGEAENDRIKVRKEMGNQQSSPVDIPVYFKAGYGVSFCKPIEGSKLIKRKPSSNPYQVDPVLRGNLRNKNGLIAFENTDSDLRINEINNEINARNRVRRVPDLSELRIEIDESGFVDSGEVETNDDKLSHSLKGNFSPTSLCEKNFNFGIDSEHVLDDDAVGNNLNEGFIIENDVKHSPNVDRLNLERCLHKSSVLLTPPSEDESSSSNLPNSDVVTHSRHSTKSEVSDIHSEIAEVHQLETDEEREQLSPLPLDSSARTSPERVCPKKLKLKLYEIRSQSASQSANSSSCTSPESYSYGHRNSLSGLSGVSSPDLELLNNESLEDPDISANTFVKLEDEFHGVEDEFESISKDIHELTKKYSEYEEHIGSGSAIFKEIFQRYPSIRVRQSEKGIHIFRSERSESESEEHNLNSILDEDERDLSWDVENLMDAVYSEGSEPSSAAQALVQKLHKVSEARFGHDTSVDTSSLNSSSVNCSVDLGGSLYEDEFHLHLGTRALPKIEEQSPENNTCGCDNLMSDCGTSSGDNSDKQCGNILGDKLDYDCLETGVNQGQDPEKVTCSETMEETGFQQKTTDRHIEHETIENGHETLDSGHVDNTLDVLTPENVCSMDVETAVSTDSVLSANSADVELCSPLSISSPELCSPINVSTLCNIGERVDVNQYAANEWRGDTPRARTIREAYRALPQHCQCSHLRQIRGDNYCGIRSTVYQTLVNCLPPLNIWASTTEVLGQLKKAYSDQSSGIQQWNFAKRISFTKENQFAIMQRCISTLYAKMKEINQLSSYSEREAHLVHLMNSECDLDLMEGVKLLMLLSALRLHSDMEQGYDVPVFAWLMFARDTSENVAGFVRNHLNQVGDSGGLEQVEMCLLGYSLGVRIQVFRLQHFHQEDFISFYPEDGTDSWPVVSLIAEDDRHYNIPVL